jgi:hypothetical protein
MGGGPDSRAAGRGNPRPVLVPALKDTGLRSIADLWQPAVVSHRGRRKAWESVRIHMNAPHFTGWWCKALMKAGGAARAKVALRKSLRVKGWIGYDGVIFDGGASVRGSGPASFF